MNDSVINRIQQEKPRFLPSAKLAAEEKYFKSKILYLLLSYKQKLRDCICESIFGDFFHSLYKLIKSRKS